MRQEKWANAGIPVRTYEKNLDDLLNEDKAGELRDQVNNTLLREHIVQRGHSLIIKHADPYVYMDWIIYIMCRGFFEEGAHLRFITLRNFTTPGIEEDSAMFEQDDLLRVIPTMFRLGHTKCPFEKRRCYVEESIIECMEGGHPFLIGFPNDRLTPHWWSEEFIERITNPDVSVVLDITGGLLGDSRG